MSSDLSLKASTKTLFPATEIRACLQAELIRVVESHAEILEIPLPTAPAAIIMTPFSIDSLDAVEILCKVDELVGFDLPQTIVHTGGYDSIEHAIHHLMPGIEKAWLKRKGGAT